MSEELKAVVARDVVHDAVCRALREAGLKPGEVYFGMCLEAGLDEVSARIEAATAPMSGLSGEVRKNEDGTLDEIVGFGGYHLEQMNFDHWWLQVGPHVVNFRVQKRTIRAYLSENERPDADAAYLATAPADSLGVVSEEMVTRAARTLADISADACNVNREDNWNIYSESFISDARAALIAALQERQP
jgi:hypothetical protein